MARGATEHLSRYSDPELALIAELLEGMIEFSRAQMKRIQALPEKPRRKPKRAAGPGFAGRAPVKGIKI